MGAAEGEVDGEEGGGEVVEGGAEAGPEEDVGHGGAVDEDTKAGEDEAGELHHPADGLLDPGKEAGILRVESPPYLGLSLAK